MPVPRGCGSQSSSPPTPFLLQMLPCTPPSQSPCSSTPGPQPCRIWSCSSRPTPSNSRHPPCCLTGAPRDGSFHVSMCIHLLGLPEQNTTRGVASTTEGHGPTVLESRTLRSGCPGAWFPLKAGRICSIFPSCWGSAGNCWHSLARTSITPISAFRFPWPSPSVCVSVHSYWRKVPSCPSTTSS